MLSAEKFSELLALIDTLTDTKQETGPKPNVRRAPRISYPCRVSISLGDNLDAGPTLPVQVKNISARGMCFLHSEAMKRDTNFVVKLEAPAGETVAILCTTIHCQPLDKHTFQIGAEFACVVNKPAPQTQQETAEDLMRIRASILS